MNRKEFDELVQATVASTANLLVLKGAEYTDGKDRLSNFKKESADIGVTPLQLCLVYMNKHYTSVKTYVRKDAEGEQQILSEPIESRFDDLISYYFLMKALVKEQQNDKNKVNLDLANPTNITLPICGNPK